MLEENRTFSIDEEWKLKFFTSVSIFTLGTLNGAVIVALISVRILRRRRVSRSPGPARHSPAQRRPDTAPEFRRNPPENSYG